MEAIRRTLPRSPWTNRTAHAPPPRRIITAPQTAPTISTASKTIRARERGLMLCASAFMAASPFPMPTVVVAVVAVVLLAIGHYTIQHDPEDAVVSERRNRVLHRRQGGRSRSDDEHHAICQTAQDFC